MVAAYRSLLLVVAVFSILSPLLISTQPVVLGPATISTTAGPLLFKGAINPNYYLDSERQCILAYFRENFNNFVDEDDQGPVVRLAFHDAMAGGANGSLMKQDSEQSQQPTLSGYDDITDLKNGTEQYCGVHLSYADALVLASATGTQVTGGNDFLDKLQLGRVDVAFADSPSLVPNSYWTTVPGYERWRQVGFSVKDFVAISGAHTIGCAHCTTILERLTVLNSTWLNAAFREYLVEQCEAVLNGSVSIYPVPVAGGGPNSGPQVNLDNHTPTVWDNGYYINLLNSTGVLISDQALMSDTTIPETAYWVEVFAADNDAFLEAYEDAFVKMSLVGLQVVILPPAQYPAVPVASSCISDAMAQECTVAFTNGDVCGSSSLSTSDMLQIS